MVRCLHVSKLLMSLYLVGRVEEVNRPRMGLVNRYGIDDDDSDDDDDEEHNHRVSLLL